MKLYHVNDKGETGLCQAKVDPCPFGVPGDPTANHYPTKGEAANAYAEKMQARFLVTHKSNRPKEIEVRLDSIMDIDLLQKMLDERFINTSVHPDDPNLVVLTYSHNAQNMGRWNEVTKQARGLILHKGNNGFSDSVIVERPWSKFFTLQQMTSTDGNAAWALGDEEDGQGDVENTVDSLDFNAPAEVTDKLDGSMGILFIAPDGEVALSTKGSMKSDQALYYTKMLRKNEKFLNAAKTLKQENPNTTFLFELVGKDNQIVLEYDKDDIIFLGAVDKQTGKYHSTSDFTNVWSEDKGLNSTEVMKANNLHEALTLPDRENREGVVVRIMSDDPSKQMQVKFKQADYLKMHRMLSAVSKTSMKRLVRDSTADLDDLVKVGRTGEIAHIPEIGKTLKFYEEGGTPLHRDLAVRQREAFNEVILPQARKIAEIKDSVDAMPQSAFEGDKREAMKKFAISIKDNDSFTKAQKFECFRARLNGSPWGNQNAARLIVAMADNIKFKKAGEDAEDA